MCNPEWGETTVSFTTNSNTAYDFYLVGAGEEDQYWAPGNTRRYLLPYTSYTAHFVYENVPYSGFPSYHTFCGVDTTGWIDTFESNLPTPTPTIIVTPTTNPTVNPTVNPTIQTTCDISIQVQNCTSNQIITNGTFDVAISGGQSSSFDATSGTYTFTVPCYQVYQISIADSDDYYASSLSLWVDQDVETTICVYPKEEPINEGPFNLWVCGYDCETHRPLSVPVSLGLSDGQTNQTTGPCWVYNDLTPNIYTLTASAPGYFASQQSFLVTENSSTSVYLCPEWANPTTVPTNIPPPTYPTVSPTTSPTPAGYGTLTVNCYDSSGSLVTDYLTVLLSSGDFTTTNSGSATFENIPYGTISIAVTGSGWSGSGSVTISGASTTVSVFLAQSGEDPGTGTHDLSVTLKNCSTGATINNPITVTAGSYSQTTSGGSTTFSALAAGDYGVSAGGGGYLPASTTLTLDDNYSITLYLCSGTAPTPTPTPTQDPNEDPDAKNDNSLTVAVSNCETGEAVHYATISLSSGAAAMAGHNGDWTFSNLNEGEYTISVSRPGYYPASRSQYLRDDSRVNICMNPQGSDDPDPNPDPDDPVITTIYNLTIFAKNADTGEVILDHPVLCEISNGECVNSTTGTASFSLPYGYYSISCTSPGCYYGATCGVGLDKDTTTNLYMYPYYDNTTPSDINATEYSGAQVAPHNVKFRVTKITGIPISECLVTATGYETTAGTWDWLYSIIGIDQDETPIATSQMSGFTDTEGEIDFMMVEVVKYQMAFFKENVISQNLTLYPHDDFYHVIADTLVDNIWYESGYDFASNVYAEVSCSDIVDDQATINVTYTDLMHGSQGTIYLTEIAEDGTTETVLDTCTIDSSCIKTISSGGCSSCGTSTTHTTIQEKECGFTVSDPAGKSYFVRIEVDHAVFGEFRKDFGITFPREQLDIGIPQGFLVLIAIFFILFVGMIFGSTSASQGSIVVCFFGWIFYAFGWLDSLGVGVPVALTLGTVVSIFAVIMVRSKRERYR